MNGGCFLVELASEPTPARLSRLTPFEDTRLLIYNSTGQNTEISATLGTVTVQGAVEDWSWDELRARTEVSVHPSAPGCALLTTSF